MKALKISNRLSKFHRDTKLKEELAAVKEENEKFRRYLLSDDKEEVKQTATDVQEKTIKDLQKKIKKAESELNELSFKNDSQHQQLEKSLELIKREVGDLASLDLVFFVI